ncbi:MAG: FkbM family methyltransferase [Cyanobacteriota bacterium]|nr:FkbM family methyltransferase [Cyanobacteriota bacterium]
MKPIKTVFDDFKTGWKLYKLSQRHGYLQETGWLKSLKSGWPVDWEDNPLPWFSYSAIDFLSQRIKKEFTVFEFGSGNSTVWWSNKCREVDSCEHDRNWYDKVKPLVPSNVNLRHVELGSGLYSESAIKTGKKFDILVIDGRERNECCRKSVESLLPNGVIIFDDSQRPNYREGCQFLEAQFKRLDFIGLGPVTDRCQSTSVFYRENNCLKL